MNERIGPYVIESRIGMGGMGIVYAARDEALNRRVALKVISPQFADDAEFRERFIREARAMASLHSPHVVSVYAHDETDGQLWMATQFFPDGDLGTMLRRSGPPSLPEALELVAQVTDGLSAAHAAGLVHRDIKPANVLLCRNGLTWNAALADFGIARAGGDQGGLTQGAMVGTPSFMAPELHTGGVASPASDIYSVGCLLWTTLSGTTPYAGATDYEIVSSHLAQPIPQLEATTPLARNINTLLHTALSKDPASRFADAAQFRDGMRAALRSVNEGPTVVRRTAIDPPITNEASHEPASHNRRLSRPLLVAVGAAVVVTGLGWSTATLWPETERDQIATTPRASTPTSAARSPSDPPTSSPSDDTSTPDTDGASSTPKSGTGGYTDEDRAKARQSFTAALETQAAITPDTAACLATEILAGEGLQQLVDARYFDKNWTYVDHDLAPYPDIKAKFTTASVACTAQ